MQKNITIEIPESVDISHMVQVIAFACLYSDHVTPDEYEVLCDILKQLTDEPVEIPNAMFENK
jgi:hypothetical protein